MGAAAIRYAQLGEKLAKLGYAVRDLGDVESPVLEALPSLGDQGNLEAIRNVCEKVAKKLKEESTDTFAIVLGGDHSVSMGSVSGCSRGRTGVIWIDAHADFNTPETSPSGNIHGMGLAALCGLGDQRLVDIGKKGRKIDPRDVVIIGARSLDSGEKELIKKHGVTVLTMKEVDTLRIPEIANQITEKFKGFDRVHVSLDADALEPEIAPGVGTPVPGGLTYREAHLLMELLSESGIVTSLDLVEVNPILDISNRTAAMMVELACSLLGKKIL